MYRMTRLMGIAVLASSALVPGLVSTRDTSVQLAAQNVECVQSALAQKLDSWVCYEGSLQAPAIPAAHQDGGAQAVQSRQAPSRVRLSRLKTLVPMSTTPEPTNYDTYCETLAECTGFRSAYISWTKGNAIYGDSHGGIGSFDVIIRTNLNGRQMQWHTQFFRDSGPSIAFQKVFINCFEDNGLLWLDSNCGVHAADGAAGNFSVVAGVGYKSGTIYGNKLVNSNDYYATIGGYFTPAGYTRYVMNDLKAAHANCFGSDNCYFPGAA
jgi:hypothetical protein